jgi:hypothetical protein
MQTADKLGALPQTPPEEFSQEKQALANCKGKISPGAPHWPNFRIFYCRL